MAVKFARNPYLFSRANVPVVPVVSLPKVTNGLLGYYKFENNLNDSSGAGKNLGILNSTVTYNATTINTGTAYTPNSTSAVGASHSGLPSGNSARTLSCWVFYDTGQTQRSLIFGTGSFGTTNANFDLEINGYSDGASSPGWITVHWWGNGNKMWQGVESIQGKWTNFTLVHAGGDLNATNTKLYVNSIQQGSWQGSAVTLNTSGTHNIVTGRRFINSYNDLGWSGGIDNMMYFNRALTEEEVIQLFNNRNNEFDLSSQVIPL